MRSTSDPVVAVVVLTWNQRDLTLDCLASLAKLNYPSDRLQIIVVDNNSADDTVQAIRSQFPEVVVLENGDNLGYAEGNNVGIRFALQSSAEYIVLLNNDTIVDRQMIKELLAVTDARPDVGVVGPKMLYFDPPDVIWCAGNRIDWHTGSTFRVQADELDSNLDHEWPRDVDFITGCAICVRRAVIEQIGLLDARFFIYYEETDWCVRAQAAGWRILYVPTARLWHRVSVTMGATSPATDYYMHRNVLLFLSKNQRGLSGLVSVARAAGRNLITVAAYTVKPWGGKRIPHRNVRLLALRDAVLGRWGRMGPDVAKVCHISL